MVLVSSQLLHLPHQGPDLVTLQLQLMLRFTQLCHCFTQLCGLMVQLCHCFTQLFILLGQLLLHCLHCLHSLKTAQ